MTTSRLSIQQTFELCKQQKKTAFVSYLSCGYPHISETVPLMHALEAGGADIIELGVPFSDPQADGPTIQRTHEVGVKQGITVDNVLEAVVQARAQGLKCPIVLMGYLNNFIAYGLEKVCEESKRAGADGFIIVDLPPEEANEMSGYCLKHGMSLIPLLSPTTSEDRMKKINNVAQGFIYCVSLTGVTGARSSMSTELGSFMDSVRKHVSLPTAIGFGLSTKEHVREAGNYADGAVIGSEIVKVINAAPDDAASRAKAVKEFCLSITQ